MSERDTMTFAGAHELAAIIRAYWVEHGVKVWVEEIPHIIIDGHNRSRVHCVRSDLVNGLPAPIKKEWIDAASISLG